MHTTLRWAPRVLGIFAILFISSFALDVFSGGGSFLQALIGLSIHLIPSAVLVVLLAIAWKHERMGGILFIALSFAPFFLLSNQFYVNALLCAPFLLTGVLFLVSSRSASQDAHVS